MQFHRIIDIVLQYLILEHQKLGKLVIQKMFLRSNSRSALYKVQQIKRNIPINKPLMVNTTNNENIFS